VNTALLVVAILAAGAACPLMMWIQSRRGRAAACCLPRRDQEGPATLDELRRRRAEVDALIAEHGDAYESSREPSRAPEVGPRA
jgi:hypothetical protein